MNLKIRITNSIYNAYMSSEEWYELKKKYYLNNKKICKKCNCKKIVYLHHKTYERFGKEELDDLECLCNECHKQVHREKQVEYKNFYINISIN